MQARPGWLATRWPKSARGEPLAESMTVLSGPAGSLQGELVVYYTFPYGGDFFFK